MLLHRKEEEAVVVFFLWKYQQEEKDEERNQEQHARLRCSDCGVTTGAPADLSPTTQQHISPHFTGLIV